MSRHIYITNDNRVAKVDDEDYDRLTGFNWRVSSQYGSIQWHHSVNNKTVSISLASMILKTDKMVDHIDRDPFNNQKSNLRICNTSQNRANSAKRINSTSKYTGVRKMKSGSFQARIKNGRQEVYLGSFSSEDEAALAYDTKAKELFGEFAKLNLNT